MQRNVSTKRVAENRCGAPFGFRKQSKNRAADLYRVRDDLTDELTILEGRDVSVVAQAIDFEVTEAPKRQGHGDVPSLQQLAPDVVHPALLVEGRLWRFTVTV